MPNYEIWKNLSVVFFCLLSPDFCHQVTDPKIAEIAELPLSASDDFMIQTSFYFITKLILNFYLAKNKKKSEIKIRYVSIVVV